MTDDLIARLRLLQRYHGDNDAGEAADALEAQARRIAELEEEHRIDVIYLETAASQLEDYTARIAELTAALKPFSDCGVWDGYKDEEVFKLGFKIADLRAARAALGEDE
jgi:hypothetical protein